MTVSPVKAKFIAPLMGVFKRVPGADEREYFKLLLDKLSGFDPVDLAAAADTIAANAESQTWPLLKVCVDACRNAEAARRAEERKAEASKDQPGRPAMAAGGEGLDMPEEAALRILAADAPEIARAACDGDWISQLVEFVRHRKRVPQGREVEEIRREKIRLDASIEDHVANVQRDDVVRKGTVYPHVVNLMVKGLTARRAALSGRMRAVLGG